jgi:hypothetical protein
LFVSGVRLTGVYRAGCDGWYLPMGVAATLATLGDLP